MDAIASLLVCLDAIYWVEFRILPIVSRRHGSVMICSLVISGSCFKTMSVDSALVDIYIFCLLRLIALPFQMHSGEVIYCQQGLRTAWEDL